MIDKICNNKYARYLRLIAFFYASISIFVYAGAKSDKETPLKNIFVSNSLNCNRLYSGYNYYKFF